MSKRRKIPYTQALFLYTCIYVRLFGYIDECPPEESSPQWTGLVKNLPSTQKEQLKYIYQKYLDHENKPKPKTNQTRFGCFSYSYHKDKNQFELHFGAHDPKGNLGTNRIKARMEDWKNLFQDMYSQGKHNSTCKIDTWLLNIESFRRLLPPEFINSAHPLYTGNAQTLTYWGPLLNRFGKIKSSMKKEFLYKIKNESHKHIEDYFPRRALTSEVKTEIFYDFYLHIKK
jgi:hypothetical protein